MDVFANPKFGKSILGIAQAYGDFGFWTENLAPRMNPDATWRALLVVGALKDSNFAKVVRRLLVSPDSRVHAWACFALGQWSRGDCCLAKRSATLEDLTKVVMEYLQHKKDRSPLYTACSRPASLALAGG
jgi:hypothetical protein